MRAFVQKPKVTPQTTSAKSTKPDQAFSGQSREVDSILHLQRTMGNQAVQRFLMAQTENLEASSASSTSLVTSQPLALQQVCGTRSCEAPYVPIVQRIIEVRPPGRGEASAFDRRQELIERLNAQSAAIQYQLEGRVLRYEIVDKASLSHFDRQMKAFIDQGEVVPMRLITGRGYVRGQTGTYEPLLHDEWISGYVDLDDLLASDDLGLQSQLIHILTERFATRNYERRIGTTTFTLAEFNRVHRTSYDAEARLFQDVMGDPTIRYLYSEERPNGTWVVAFRSAERYRIFKVFRRAGREVQGAEVWAQTRDGRRLTIEQLRAERVAAPAPAAR